MTCTQELEEYMVNWTKNTRRIQPHTSRWSLLWSITCEGAGLNCGVVAAGVKHDFGHLILGSRLSEKVAGPLEKGQQSSCFRNEKVLTRMEMGVEVGGQLGVGDCFSFEESIGHSFSIGPLFAKFSLRWIF